MKRIPFILSLFVLPVFAQSYGGMSNAQMQQMMSKMTEMQACYEKVDQSQLEKMTAEAKLFEIELRELCSDGHRDQAQDRAIQLGSELESRPEIRQLRQCAEIAKGMMPVSSIPEIPDFADPETFKDRHVCDQL